VLLIGDELRVWDAAETRLLGFGSVMDAEAHEHRRHEQEAETVDEAEPRRVVVAGGDLGAPMPSADVESDLLSRGFCFPCP
jgi:hypothetical protein